MHAEAHQYVQAMALRFGPWNNRRVVEFGSRDVNGSVRHMFPGADYLGIDIAEGPGVDLVADAADWQAPELADAVVCCETLEHAERWREIVASAARTLAPGGVMILTAACHPREPHSGVDGWNLRDGEWYGNVDPIALAEELSYHFGERDVTVLQRGDVRAWAIR